MQYVDMECAKQGYWSWEYHEFSEHLVDSTANHNYAQFCKRQYHKARRRHDKEIIKEQLIDHIITNKPSKP